jgi:hypothetical protein
MSFSENLQKAKEVVAIGAPIIAGIAVLLIVVFILGGSYMKIDSSVSVSALWWLALITIFAGAANKLAGGSLNPLRNVKLFD